MPDKINPIYPKPGDEGRFTLGCSCKRWSFEGTAEECIEQGRTHDDSPFKQHVVFVTGWHE
jgi:hypothetical protein